MRLIDADALPVDAFLNTKMVLQTDIDNAPTIDAVPVVRCEDCVWFDEHGYYCNKNEMFVENSEWYCAEGERKDDEGKFGS